jgi:uncharacterized protein (TIGR02271 family)
MLNLNDILGHRGRTIHDASGSPIGELDEVYLDNDTQKPEWGRVGGRFVPLADATERDGALTVAFGTEQIQTAPAVDGDKQISQQEEQTLYAHYGLPYGEQRSDSGLPEGGTVGQDTSGPNTDNAMTRSEEELVVGKQTREAGVARLRKYVETETVTQTVPVAREELVVEREPITEGNVDQALDGPAISEEEHEVVLHEETAVAGTRVVPKERVRLDKETVVEEQTVSEEVRKERIELDDATNTTR